MTFSHELRTNQDNHVLKVLIRTIVDFAIWVSTIPWIVGLVPVVIFGFLSTVVSYFPLRIARKKAQRLLRKIEELKDQMPQRDAAEIHADIEEMKSQLEAVTGKLKDYYIFKPLVSECLRIIKTYEKIELVTFNVAYPDYDKPLTKEEENKIKDIFKSWEEDWKDSKMDVYNE